MSAPPPCPFPTQIECNCLFGLLATGFDGANTTTFPTVIGDSTVERYHLTGEWVGLDAITEYQDAFGGDFFSSLEIIGTQFLDLSGSTEEECVMLSGAPTRVRTVADKSVNGVSQCVDFVGGVLYRYRFTGDPAMPVLLTEWDGWTPDDFIPSVFFPIDSPATAEFVCDVLVNVCDEEEGEEDWRFRRAEGKQPKAPKQEKEGKKGKEPKKGKKSEKDEEEVDPMQQCLERLAALPPNDNEYWIDGDSRHCRILHSMYAATNPQHCPHVSFEKQADVNGLFKCYQSKFQTAEDVFTPEQLEFFRLNRLPYPSEDPWFAAYPDGSCPPV